MFDIGLICAWVFGEPPLPLREDGTGPVLGEGLVNTPSENTDRVSQQQIDRLLDSKHFFHTQRDYAHPKISEHIQTIDCTILGLLGAHEFIMTELESPEHLSCFLLNSYIAIFCRPVELVRGSLNCVAQS